jgi:hypothetical protein
MKGFRDTACQENENNSAPHKLQMTERSSLKTWKRAMEKLPTEIIFNILYHLGPASQRNARLACRAFRDTLTPYTFRTLRDFLDLQEAQLTLERIANAPTRKAKEIWSPFCAVPCRLAVEEGFLLALFCCCSGRSWDGNTFGGVTAASIATTLARTDLTESKLRTIQHKYSLYLSYISGDLNKYCSSGR